MISWERFKKKIIIRKQNSLFLWGDIYFRNQATTTVVQPDLNCLVLNDFSSISRFRLSAISLFLSFVLLSVLPALNFCEKHITLPFSERFYSIHKIIYLKRSYLKSCISQGLDKWSKRYVFHIIFTIYEAICANNTLEFQDMT